MLDPIKYTTSLLTFYMKGEIRQEENFLKLKVPNTLFKFIPFGSRNYALPINQIATVETNFKLSFFSLLFGALFTLLGFSLISDSAIPGLIVALLGINMGISAFQTVMTIKTTDAAEHRISFLIFDKPKAEYAAKVILKYVSNRLDDTNVRRQNTVLGDRLVDAINDSKSER